MAGSREFEKHLFISYAHIDNLPLTREQQGWVSRFHVALDAMLSMRIGGPARIWRDQKLAGNDIFADEILAQFSKTALLISVLTPRYVASDWCAREVREFCKAAEQSGGVVVDRKLRVIKVIKTPVDDDHLLPEVLRDVLGYQFYVFDAEQTPLELDPAYGPDIEQKFNLKLAKLAWDISKQLKQLEDVTRGESPDTGPHASKPTVYLAETSWDQRQSREALETELRLHGYAILPDAELPRDEAGYVAEVTRLLTRAELSVHLVGAGYGAVPDGPAQRSVVVLQNELAVARSQASGLRRVIWLPAGITTSHGEQQTFIDALQHDAVAQAGADLIVGDIEAVKAAVHAALARLRMPEPPPAREGAGVGPLVYLICDERDRPATVPLRKYLKSRGLDVQIPIFEGDAATVRRGNQDLLARCDAVVVFYGAGDESWKRAVDSDLRKMKGYRGDRPLRASYTYLAEPATGAKTDLLEMEEPNLMNGLAGLSEPAVERLVKTLGPA